MCDGSDWQKVSQMYCRPLSSTATAQRQVATATSSTERSPAPIAALAAPSAHSTIAISRHYHS